MKKTKFKKAKDRHWSMHSKPTFWHATPKKPTKTLEKDTRDVLYSTTMHCEGRLNLSDVELPEGASWNDVEITVEVSNGSTCDYGYEGASADVEVVLVHKATEENVNYEKLLKFYEEELVEYKIAKAAHRQEVKEWTLWVEAEKKRQLQEQLDSAEELLRLHGRI